ncbi:MAG: hypothetical protein P8J86_07950 [Phycisphaerales bacterium]|nr:hypothetical protein [Phycisphaerales bacterium]
MIHQFMKITVFAGAFVTMACAMVGCSSSGSIDPAMLQAEARPPQWPVGWTPDTGRERPDNVPTIAMDANGWAKTTVTPVIIDTRKFPKQRQAHETDPGPGVRPGTLLRAHKRDKTLPPGPRLDLPLGRLLEEPRVDAAPNFPAISATVWTPPDPTLAVGPDHIVATVNMAIAFYDRDGNEQFYANLDSTGSPGFFETVGSGDFCFDPKCFYDPYSERFFVLALEFYDSSGESWITVAVSDDSDPNGVWYKYRTWAVLTIEGSDYWVDYPGLGFNEDTFYTTNNLFLLSGSGPGFRGAMYRLFPKAPMLVGDPVTWTDVNDTSSASVQCAQIYDAPPGTPPFFVSGDSSSSMKIQAIRSEGGQPDLRSASVAIPGHDGGPPGAVNPGGSINALDGRLMNVNWRNGQLYTAHAIESGNRSESRWYHFDTGNWPGVSGNPPSPTLVQSGAIDFPEGQHSFYPAIASNKYDDVGLVIGYCRSDLNPNVQVTGRMKTDSAGSMGSPVIVVESPSGADGRWGDYFDLTVDPLDDTTFWYIGEWASNGGWQTWIGSFEVTEPRCDGDANGDNIVNLDDFSQLLIQYGTTGESTADFNGDLVVDLEDFTLLLINYGNVCSN